MHCLVKKRQEIEISVCLMRSTGSAHDHQFASLGVQHPQRGVTQDAVVPPAIQQVVELPNDPAWCMHGAFRVRVVSVALGSASGRRRCCFNA